MSSRTIWLHPEIGHDQCFAEDTPDAFAAPGFRLPNSQLAEGYSRKERRESEANLFAAELLLPGPVLRQLFLEHRWKASRFAAHSGLSLSCVLTQLASALLLGNRGQGTGNRKGKGERGRGGEDNAERGMMSDELNSHSSLITHHSSLSFPLNPQLDDSQRAAAHIEYGPVLVDAGPGTGKTRTLIARILFLLTERGVAPENILALTFSNKAAEEMHTRLRGEVGDLADRVWIGTFHAFGRELLRKEGTRIGLPAAPDLLDMPDAIKLLQDNMDRLTLRRLEYLSFPILPFPDILDCISRAKDELKTPQEYALVAQRQLADVSRYTKKADVEKHLEIAEKSQEVAHVYAVYQKLLKAEGKLDFGDLIMRSVELLDTCPDVKARWQAQYPHILADEYQDINRASAQLVQRLAGNGRGLWAVGDLRQAIYRFRGASSANVRKFDEDFPGGQRIQLERNYRSRPALVAMFGAYAGTMAGATATFADWQPHRSDPSATQDAPGTPAVTVAVADNEEAQAAGMAAHIRQAEEAGVGLRDQVILCNTHRQASRLAELLGANGIETQHASGLFDREETKDLLALLSLACEPEGTALARVARFAEYDIPAQDVSLLLQAARERRKTFPAALTLAAHLPDISAQGQNALLKLFRHIEPYLYHGTAWAFLAGYLFETSDYLLPLLRDSSVAGRQKLLAVHELLMVTLRLAARFEADENQQAALLNHLRFLLRCGQEKALRVSGDDAELDGVRLMTVHKSKGLEFPIVYLPNLVKGQFPLGKMGSMVSPPASWLDASDSDTEQGEPSEAEEENSEAECLFFVALSRARDVLVLSRPATWNGKPIPPSALLTSCEAALQACNARHVDWKDDIKEEGPQNDVVTFSNSPEIEARVEAEAQAQEAASNQDVTQNGSTIMEEPQEEPLTLSASAVEQYRNCPRQYYYQRVLKLPQGGEDTTYLTFHNTLQETVAWLQAERAEGRTPTPEDINEKLRQAWHTRPNAPDNAHARVLQAKARGMLAAGHHNVGGATEEKRGVELTAQLAHGAVQVRVDHAEETAEGQWRLTTYKAQRGDSDHTNPRLALARHAARQQSDLPVQIVLGYLQDGEQREVEEKKHLEPARVAKYDEALKGIREKRFAPNPGQECSRCPFFLICPL